MGLQEKQAWAAVNEEVKTLIERIPSITGKPITVTLDNPSFQTVEVIKRVPDCVVGPLVSGLDYLCQDALAKEAVSEAIKSVRIAHTNDDAFAMKINGSELEVKGNFGAESVSGLQYPHANDYQSFLTKSL